MCVPWGSAACVPWIWCIGLEICLLINKHLTTQPLHHIRVVNLLCSNSCAVVCIHKGASPKAWCIRVEYLLRWLHTATVIRVIQTGLKSERQQIIKQRKKTIGLRSKRKHRSEQRWLTHHTIPHTYTRCHNSTFVELISKIIDNAGLQGSTTRYKNTVINHWCIP